MKSKIWPNGIATLFGVGKAFKAPGTAGSLVSLPLAYGLSLFGPFVYMAVTMAFIVVAIMASDLYGKGKDLKEIVVDESAGVLVTFFIVPQSFKFWVVGFLLFRFFDILKPFPISYLDKNVKGGFGVVLDDLVAGLFANACLHFVFLGMGLHHYLNFRIFI